MNIPLLVVSVVVGFLITKFFSAKKEGQRSRFKSLKFRVGSRMLHIHHWLYGSIILLFLWYMGFYNDIVYGFLIGIIVQGLTYKDFYFIYYNEEQYRKKYPLKN